MNAHNQNLDTNGAEPVKPTIPVLAAEHLGTSYIQMLLQELKAAPDVWQKLSENQQHEIIERARQNAARSIAGAVNAIITNGHTALKGDHFVAEYLGHQSKSKISPDVALSGLSAKLGLTGNIHHEEITTEHDKDVQVRRFVIKADQAKEAGQ